jgi:cell filamentation protein
VYPWAGELRTVTTAKCEPFAKPEEIELIMAHVADRVEQSRQLRGLGDAAVCTELARVHHETNLAHPFRLGNGRAQREFVTALAGVSSHTIDWSGVTGEAEADALRRARRGDLAPLTVLYASSLGQLAPDSGPSVRRNTVPVRSAGVWR